MKSKKIRPDWTETAPVPGTFRSVTKYGDPNHFKHPSDAWVEMMRQEFHMSDSDFADRQNEGNDKIILNRPPALKSGQIEKLAAIVGKANISLDDYSRVKYAYGKTTEEMLELRQGIIREVADVVVHPRDKHDVQKIVEYCNQERIPVTVFSAGSSVNFGCRPAKGGVSLVVSTHMNKLLEINELNQTARVQPGMFVAFRTGFIEEVGYGNADYFSAHPQLSQELIHSLLQKRIAIIGVDFAGIRRGKEHTPADQACADQGVFVVENLCNLAAVLSGQSAREFSASTYPVNFSGMTGLPCRVVARL